MMLPFLVCFARNAVIASGFSNPLTRQTRYIFPSPSNPHLLNTIPTRSRSISITLYGGTENSQSKHPHIKFVSPLLEDGYPPAVIEYQEQLATHAKKKPLLLYLPGFDGTILAPFIQFPSLAECFDVRGMRVGMEDRSTFEDLKAVILEYISCQCQEDQDFYLMGESFGGIMAIEVARELRFLPEYAHVKMKGLALVNPATSYLRSSLYKLGPPIANNSSIIPPITFLLYIYSLANQLVPLFLDEGRALQQLVLMLSSKALPAVLNTPQREAYLGRVAFDLVNRLKFMPQETLKWRLEEWLQRGCTLFESRLEKMQQQNDSREGLETLKKLQTLIVVGEIDLTLPSVEEAQRLSSTVFDSTKIHVVPEAGHASTCGGSLQLVQLMRDFFSCLDKNVKCRYKLPDDPELFGLVPRYDNALIGMSPLDYWKKEYFIKIDELN